MHDAIGRNDRLPNLNAALGVDQLEDLSRRLDAKRHLAKLYMEAFAPLAGIDILTEPEGCRSNHWLVTARFTDENPYEASRQRDQALQKCHDEGLLLRPVWTPLHQLRIYSKAQQGDLTTTEDQAQRLLNLPSSPQLLMSWKR